MAPLPSRPPARHRVSENPKASDGKKPVSLFERVRRARETSRHLFDSAPIARLVVAEGGKIEAANARARALGFVRGQRAGDRFVKKDRKRLNAHLKRAIAGRNSGRCELTLEPNELQAARASVQIDHVGGRSFVTIIEQPLTTGQATRFHLHRLLEAQDAERRRLSLELHDGIGQTLGALEVGLAHLGGISGEEPVRERAALLRETVRGAALELRRLARGLYPRVLEDHGLRPALERLVLDTRALSGIGILLGVDDCHIPRNAMLAVYRVVQEALSNVVRHSGARTVRIEIVHARGRVTGSIEDDGCGFAVGEQGLTGLGLRGMRERIEQFGGLFRIGSWPNEGTTVAFEFRVPEEEKERQ
jgi:signal transduction histidine kinase